MHLRKQSITNEVKPLWHKVFCPGGDCVDDIGILERDERFCRVLGRVETKGLGRQQTRAMERRWRKERLRSVKEVVREDSFPKMP